MEKLDGHAKEVNKLQKVLNTKVATEKDEGYEIKIYNDLKIRIFEYHYGCSSVGIDVKNWGRVKRAIDKLLDMEVDK